MLIILRAYRCYLDFKTKKAKNESPKKICISYFIDSMTLTKRCTIILYTTKKEF